MWLLLVAFFGFAVPNGLFLFWLFFDFSGVAGVFQNRLALAFILDTVMAVVLLAFAFAKSPIGRIRWPWFVLLSLVGGLGFSLPFYVWLNTQWARPRLS